MAKNKKMIIGIALICIALMTVQSMALGSEVQLKKNLEAWYNTITIYVNGIEMHSETKPFVVEGITYVPLRMMADIFNKNTQWDPATHRISITDKPNNDVQNLRNQIIMKDIEISSLKNRIVELEAELEENEVIDMDDLEDQLKDDYDEYEDAEFEITLSGDEDDVIVKIEIDLDDYQDEWDDLDEDDIEDYLQNIVDDILDEYEDADIEGYIEDSASDDELVEFNIDSDGDVDMSGYSSSIDLDDLEDNLDGYYYDYFDDIDVAIRLDGDEDDIEFIVYLNYDTYENEWDALSDDDIEEFMSYIFNDIEDEYEDADIEGYIYDDDNDEYIYEY